jgi:hypothetical protein
VDEYVPEEELVLKESFLDHPKEGSQEPAQVNLEAQEIPEKAYIL